MVQGIIRCTSGTRDLAISMFSVRVFGLSASSGQAPQNPEVALMERDLLCGSVDLLFGSVDLLCGSVDEFTRRSLELSKASCRWVRSSTR